MRRCPPASGGSNLKGSLPQSRSPETSTGQDSNTQRSVIAALAATAPGLTFGAGPSKSTHERPCASWPVTTRRIGFTSCVIRPAPFRNEYTSVPREPHDRTPPRSMRLCRFDKNRLGIVQGGEVLDVTKALEAIPGQRWPLAPGDPLIANLKKVLAAAK